MSLPGGPADKLGNRYETWWTVWQLVRMLHGACESIRIENPGIDKAEFVLSAGGRREWHQAKRSHPSGRWTLATLAGSDVELLQAIGTLLDGNTDRFVFVSATDARELAELAERSRQAETAAEFESVFLAAKEHADHFARLLKAWPGCDLHAAYDRLRRIDVRTADERTIEDLARWGLAAVYLGNSDDLVKELRTISDPDHEAWQTDAGGGRTYYNGDIYSNGINTTRGCAAEAMRDLIWRDAAYLARFRDALERMVCDPSACVRSCVAGTLHAVAYHDARLALALFHRMDAKDDRLLATLHVYEFIRSLLRDHFDELRPTVERMLRSSNADVAQSGARLAGLAALHHASAADLDREAALGTTPQRHGLAEVAAANIATDDCRAWCEERLRSFFNDADEGVRKEAAGSFRQLRDESLELYEPLILDFAGSASYRDDSMSILHFLENSLRRLPGITCVVCEKFLDRFSDEARDVRTSRMADARTVAQLIFRTYHQHQDDAWTARALDLIDRLCLEGIGDAQKEFDTFER